MLWPGSRGPCRLSFPFFPWRWSLPLLFFSFSGGCDVVIKLEWSRHRSLQVVREKLLLNDEGLCLPCENDELRRQLVESDLILAQCRREKKELYNSLIAERNRRLCCAEEEG